MKKRTIFFSIFLIFTLTSCARAPVKPTVSLSTIEPYPTIPKPEMVMTIPEVIRNDIYHEVGPGETLFRIAKMYDVGIQDIVMANDLIDPNKLEKGQSLIIPKAAPLRTVIPLYPSTKWKYIIIHHSATDVGKALSFDYVHKNKRQWKGIGYHFVIDNGTSGKEDGQIEVSPRWIHQEDGAHCKAGSMNYRGIGICLVGNFNQDSVTGNQIESLVFLVNELKRYYRIPNSRILGHGQVEDAVTDCPGTQFPWHEFRSRLNP